MRIVAALVILLPAFAASAHAQIVAFGAGNFAGWNVAAAEAIPAQLQAMLRSKGYRLAVLNAGIYGDTTTDLRTRMDRDIPAGTAIVILDTSGGLYDDTQKGISRAQGMADLAAIRARLAGRHIKVIAFSAASIPPQYHQPDGVSLTPQGHRLAASNLMAGVMPMLGAPPPLPQIVREDPCTADARRLCPQQLGDDAKLHLCMLDHRAQRSKECLRAIAAGGRR